MPGLGGYSEILNIPAHLRRLFIKKFIDQKQKEEQAIERERKKAK
jgi:hypothetical protein